MSAEDGSSSSSSHLHLSHLRQHQVAQHHHLQASAAAAAAALSGMLPSFDPMHHPHASHHHHPHHHPHHHHHPGLYDPTVALAPPPPKPRFVFKMPRVVPDQKAKFESDELFRRLSRESEVRFTGYRDRPLEERQVRFHNGCREGHTEIAFTATGTNIQLVFNPGNIYHSHAMDPSVTRECDFEKETGKVHLRSSFIMNGVCVRWRGWIDLDRLDGVGCLEYDDERAQIEDAMLREQLEHYNQRLREFEERQKAYRNHQQHHNNHQNHHLQERQLELSLDVDDVGDMASRHRHYGGQMTDPSAICINP